MTPVRRLPADASLASEVCRGALERAQRRPGGQRDDRAAAGARPPRRRRSPAWSTPAKDVDGLTPRHAGLLALGRPGLRPCTPSGVMLLLESGGARAARGRRGGGGRALEPVRQADGAAAARGQRDGDGLSLAHPRSRGGVRSCRRADRGDRTPRDGRGEWVKPGAVVIDVGINRLARTTAKSGLVGDVDFAAAAQFAGAITPVPGGVGPMTIALLLRNTVPPLARRMGCASRDRPVSCRWSGGGSARESLRGPGECLMSLRRVCSGECR